MYLLNRGCLIVLLAPATVLAVLYHTIRVPIGDCVPTVGTDALAIETVEGNRSYATIKSVKPFVSTANRVNFYIYGFYPLPANGRIFGDRSIKSAAMTLEVCANACSKDAYWAVQNGDECVCGSIPPSGTPINTVNAVIPCTGEAGETCGSPGLSIIYSNQIRDGISASSTSRTSSVTTISTAKTLTIPTNSISSPISRRLATSLSLIDLSTLIPSNIHSTPSSGLLQTSITKVSISLGATSYPEASSASSSPTSIQTSLNLAVASISSIGFSSSLPTRSTSSNPAEPTSTDTPNCPIDDSASSNNTIYTDIFAYSYYIKCGLQIVGDRLQSAHADSIIACLEYCDLIEGCAAITYVDSTSSTDGTCYPYRNFGGYTPSQPGVYSGVPDGGNSDGAISLDPNLCPPSGENSYNQSAFSDYFGNNYYIGCDQSVAGTGPNGQGSTDLYPTVADTLLGCLTYCSIYQACAGIDFTGPTSSSGTANCFPKYATGAITYASGTQMAYRYTT